MSQAINQFRWLNSSQKQAVNLRPTSFGGVLMIWGTPFFSSILMACSIIKHSSGQIIVIHKPEINLYWDNFPY